mmetsp:Transcript_55116/g.126748  ORF Transcript_55116/g.126748 Transcript_55116/m.126748 type:complete len:361 (-) Transcript_55116:698-1780(-)|eukprot:CAMPEP_0119384692 /NCGR_PEP_ID=MMETSP1334-20130426/87056_1 /TAXON_ID=127549 /ORGANISM="Calcidiscus leptoporus, Strain RCC1130" /LENGTH=360 /DNA_ID=CAMNT_0007405771 /DNA_START=1 /DNA_END=1083 /DNA_ORIENTATION=+
MQPAMSSTSATPRTSKARAIGSCRASASNELRVALCFYGLARNLNLTRQSLLLHLIEPLHDAIERTAAGALDVFVHGLLVEREAVQAGRTAAFPHSIGPIDYMPDWSFAHPCRLWLEDQAHVDVSQNLSVVMAQFRQQSFGYSAATSMNFVRAYYSMSRAAALVREQQARAGVHYTHVVLARSDTGLLAPIHWRAPEPWTIAVPNFQHWRGVNDRFAMGGARAMLDVLMSQYAEWQRGGVPAELQGVLPERARCFILAARRVRVSVLPMCLARVRSSGEASLCDTAPHPAVCYWSAIEGVWPWGRELPHCMQRKAGSESLVRVPGDLDDPCGNAVSVVRAMHSFGWRPTHTLPLADGASD